MLSTLFAINWQPELRGIVVVLIAAVVLIGGTYLVVGTNVGARLGFLLVIAAFFGWMMTMGAIWWTYGIGLKGPTPFWHPAEPVTIVRDSSLMVGAEILKVEPTLGGDPVANAASISTQLQTEGWHLLDEADPQRGQAVAASDAILQIEAKEFPAGSYLSVAVYDRGGERFPKINDSLDFFAFFHKPRYALVEVAPVVPQHVEPGRAPARPVVDTAQPHRYVHMLRDLGAKRQPAMFITFGSGLIFLMLCWLLHRRDLQLRANLSSETLPSKA
ncbi:MAG: hypothetical protein RL278_631 [Actinomycetota bacterium]|jgi:hypothetical protein|nr:hypothetical protein [bacterium]